MKYGNAKTAVCLDVIPYGLVDEDKCFGGTFFLHFLIFYFENKGSRFLYNIGNCLPYCGRDIPEDCSLHIYCCENLSSCVEIHLCSHCHSAETDVVAHRLRTTGV
jgi:hypothetical protein